MVTVSAVISAYNEEEKIADCLESVKWADEIVFVDNSSADKTAQIAKEHKAKVYTRPNNPMLNVNKNFGITRASGDWILYLDADERVTPELAEEIGKVISDSSTRQRLAQNDSKAVNGFWLPRKNIIFGRWMEHGGMYPDYQMRLFKKGRGKFPELHVHEMMEIDGKTEHLTENILHYNFETVSQFLYKHVELYGPNEAENLLSGGYKFSPLDAIKFPFNEFLSRFFAREGYKDGLHGLMLSIFFAFYHFIIFARIWEKQEFKEHNNWRFLEAVSNQLKQSTNETAYWITNEKIKRSKNILEKTVLKIQRKMKA